MCVLKNHAVAIHAGRIVALLPAAEARSRFDRGTAVLPRPGPDSRPDQPAHPCRHVADARVCRRPAADGLAQQAHLAGRKPPRFDAIRARRHPARLRRNASGGITSFNDMYFFPEAAAAAASGSRHARHARHHRLEFPSAYATDADDYLAKGLAMRDAAGGMTRCSASASLRMRPTPFPTPPSSDWQPWPSSSACRSTSHIHETRHEIEESRRQHGVRPLERLQRLGLLGPKFIGVHAVHLNEAEIDLLAATAATSPIARLPT